MKNKIRVHYLQQNKREDLANIESWLKKRKYKITKTLLYKNQELPALNKFDWLIIMGGPMNIYEEKKYPWLKAEKKFIKKAIKAGKKVLGICLGGQLIADCLGGKVRKNKYRETGFYPVWLTKAGRKSRLFEGLPGKMNLIHFHGDTFSIPPGCENLAYSRACKNQAFIYNDRVIGLQFHFEYSPEHLKPYLKIKPTGRKKEKYVQSIRQILGQKDKFREIKRIMERILMNIEKR